MGDSRGGEWQFQLCLSGLLRVAGEEGLAGRKTEEKGAGGADALCGNLRLAGLDASGRGVGRSLFPGGPRAGGGAGFHFKNHGAGGRMNLL